MIVATLALTGPATFALYQALGADSLGILDVLVLLTFAPLFAWTAFSFVSALAGLLAPPAKPIRWASTSTRRPRG